MRQPLIEPLPNPLTEREFCREQACLFPTEKGGGSDKHLLPPNKFVGYDYSQTFLLIILFSVM